MTTPKEVAKWMKDSIERDGELYQQDAVCAIQEDFGEEFVYENDNGNLAISKDVLKEFKKLTSETVVWERGSRFWRQRTEYDEPGKRQAD